MRIPVTIFTGFLGAGKTTIVKNLLKQCSEQKFVVIVNEFGKVSIDGPLIAQVNQDGNVEIANITDGLIAYASDEHFDDLIQEFGARGPEIDHLLIETSGLAVPTAICERLHKASSKFALDAVVSVVDTSDLLKHDQLAAPMKDVFRNQLESSDIVVFNKIDSFERADLNKAEQELRKLAPSVRFVELAHHGCLEERVLLGLHLHTTKRMQAVGIADGEERPNAQGMHSHQGWGPHEHGLHTHEHVHEHDPGWISFSLHCHQRQDQQLIVGALRSLLNNDGLFRAKGFIETKQGTFNELHCVRQQLSIGPVDATHHMQGSEIVFIGYNIRRDHISHALCTATNTEWH